MKKTVAFMLIILLVSVCSCSASQNKKIHFDYYNFHVINHNENESPAKEIQKMGLCSVDKNFRPKDGIFVIPEADDQGNSITVIGSGAIRNLSYVTEIVIGDNVEYIERYGISAMPNLRKVTIGKGLINIGEGLFAGCPLLETVEISSDNPRFSSFQGAIYANEGKTLFRAWGNLETFHENVQWIDNCAMIENMQILSLVLPETITEIGSHAFQDCTNLKSLSLPDGIQKIGKDAFYGCDGLQILLHDEIDMTSFSDGWDNMPEGMSLTILSKK